MLETSFENYKRKLQENTEIQSEYIDWRQIILSSYKIFKALEDKYNSFTLDQLKYNYELNMIIEEVEKQIDIFDVKKSKFYKYFEDLSEDEQDVIDDIENSFLTLTDGLENFIEDLKTMKSAFDMMGDIDTGIHYFKNLNLH